MTVSVWNGLPGVLVAFAFGLLAGFPALLIKRKARPFERALTDFTAVVLTGALFFAGIELGSDGRFTVYALAAFLLGAPILPYSLSKIKSKMKNKHFKRYNAKAKSGKPGK